MGPENVSMYVGPFKIEVPVICLKESDVAALQVLKNLWLTL